jgi:hypothetical protein
MPGRTLRDACHSSVGVMHPILRPLPRRALCAVLLLAHAGACSQWRRLPGSAAENVGRPSINRARLVLRDGSELILRDATIRPDSIVGNTVETRARRAVATGDVSYVDSRRPWTQRTAGGLAGLAVAGALTAIVVGFTVYITGAYAAPTPSAR